MNLTYKIIGTWKDSNEPTAEYECRNEDHVKFMCLLLEKSGLFAKVESSKMPHDKTESILLCIDSHQLNMAWEFQLWSKGRGISTVICFSMSDFSFIREAYLRLGSPHMIVKTGRHQKWDQLEYDLKLGDFNQDSFKTIYDFLD